jgi:hypothetical protein
MVASSVGIADQSGSDEEGEADGDGWVDAGKETGPAVPAEHPASRRTRTIAGLRRMAGLLG